MIFGITLLAVIYLLYLLFIKGVLWRLILFFAGGIGIHYLLSIYIEASNQTALIFSGCQISWAKLIAISICFLTLLTTND